MAGPPVGLAGASPTVGIPASIHRADWSVDVITHDVFMQAIGNVEADVARMEDEWERES